MLLVNRSPYLPSKKYPISQAISKINERLSHSANNLPNCSDECTCMQPAECAFLPFSYTHATVWYTVVFAFLVIFCFDQLKAYWFGRPKICSWMAKKFNLLHLFNNRFVLQSFQVLCSLHINSRPQATDTSQPRSTRVTITLWYKVNYCFAAHQLNASVMRGF